MTNLQLVRRPMRTTRETIGKDRYVTGWQKVRRPLDPPKWQPPAQPCGAWATLGKPRQP